MSRYFQQGGWYLLEGKFGNKGPMELEETYTHQ